MHTTKAHMVYILYVTIVHNTIYYSTKCQFFCTHEHLAGGQRDSKVCELLLKPVNKDGYDVIIIMR